MRQIMNDAHTELLRAVRRMLEDDSELARSGGLPPLTVTSVSSEPWFSATFSGQRHAIGLCLRGAVRAVATARDGLVERLPRAEFELRGHLVASVDVSPFELREEDGLGVCELRLDALTIAED